MRDKGVDHLNKIVAGKQLWNYHNLEPTEQKLILWAGWWRAFVTTVLVRDLRKTLAIPNEIDTECVIRKHDA